MTSISSTFLAKLSSRKPDDAPSSGGVKMEASMSSFSTRSRRVPSESIVISIPEEPRIEQKIEYKPAILTRPLTRMQQLTLDFLIGMCKDEYPEQPEEVAAVEDEIIIEEPVLTEIEDNVPEPIESFKRHDSTLSTRHRTSNVCLPILGYRDLFVDKDPKETFQG